MSKPRKLTRNDELVLARLVVSDRPLGAYEILKQVASEGIAAPNSVYRALRKLIALGRVRKIASIRAYAARRFDDEGEIGAYLICRRCGRAVEKPVARKSLTPLLADDSIAVDSVLIEAFGNCARADCGSSPDQHPK